MGVEAEAVDPFDLPAWLGNSEVTWEVGSRRTRAGRVRGELSAGGEHLACDLLPADVAYPEPVLGEDWRRAAHQEWTHGQVLLAACEGRLTLVVPGVEVSADRVLECLGRLAKAVGAEPARYVAALRL